MEQGALATRRLTRLFHEDLLPYLAHLPVSRPGMPVRLRLSVSDGKVALFEETGRGAAKALDVAIEPWAAWSGRGRFHLKRAGRQLIV